MTVGFSFCASYQQYPVSMIDVFDNIEEKLQHLESRLSDPDLVGNQQEYQKVVREHAHLARLHTLHSDLKQVQRDIANNRAILQDDDEDLEFKELARADIEELEEKEKVIDREIKLVLLPKDPNDDRNIFLEIRAGTGGDEAALFVADLFRMYSRFAESMGWRVEIMSSSPLGIGGSRKSSR